MLRNVSLFSDLPEDDLQAISSLATTRTYPKNTIIISEGDDSDSLYAILSGKVKVFLSDDDGREIIINILGDGQYFGELALIDDAERSASVMTLEDSSFLIISKEAFKTALGQYPEIAIRLIQEFTHRLRNMTDNIKNLALLDVYGRVAKTLLSMASEEDEHLVIHEKLTQQDIANRVGASREMVAKIMKDLTTGGYIETQGKEMIIRKRLPSRY